MNEGLESCIDQDKDDTCHSFVSNHVRLVINFPYVQGRVRLGQMYEGGLEHVKYLEKIRSKRTGSKDGPRRGDE